MNDDLTWHFDIAVIEWLIVLAMLVILSVVGTVVTRHSLKAFRKLNGKSGEPVSTSESWQTESAKVALESLDTTADGLSREEVTNRLAKHGPNRLPEPKTRSSLIRFFYQFHNVLIYVLIAASAVTAMLEHWVDASVILGVVILNALIGFVQEGKAENALKAIRQMLSPNAMVMRDGRQMTIRAEELVPGDIVLLQSGDKVPADLRLFRVKGLQIQESVLTGESMAVEKITDPVAQGERDRRSPLHGLFGHPCYPWPGRRCGGCDRCTNRDWSHQYTGIGSRVSDDPAVTSNGPVWSLAYHSHSGYCCCYFRFWLACSSLCFR